MKIVKKVSSTDGYAWRCRLTSSVNKSAKKKCETELSIRGSWLASKSQLLLTTILAFVNLWTFNTPLTIIKEQCEIGSWSTPVKLAKSCRNLLVDSFMRNVGKLGGQGKTVSISNVHQLLVFEHRSD
jgi:hypothetical protein